MKCDKDAYWITERYYANDLPLQRLPQFVETDERHLIKLLNFYEGGLLTNSSIGLTSAGRDIVLRLSQLRK